MMKANYGMSKKNSFRDYLVGRDKKSYGHLLMEGLTDIKQMIFPNVGIADAIRFLRLVPGWTNSTLDSEMTLEFMSERAVQDFKNKLDNKFLQKPLRDKLVSGLKLEQAKKVGGLSTEFKIPAPDGIADDIKERFFEQMFSAAKTFFGRNGLGSAIGTLGYKDGSVTITTDDAEMREKAWMALSAVMSNDEISENTLKAITAGNELKAKDQKAAKAAMKPFVAAIQKAMGSVKPAEASEKEKAEIKAATKSGSAGIFVKYVGNYNACSIVYMLYSDPNSQITKSWGTAAPSSLIEDSLTLDNLLRSGLLIEGPDFKAAEIEAAVTITGSVSRRQRVLLQMLDAECAPRGQEWKDGVQKQIDAINTKLKAGEGPAEDLTKQMDALKASLSRKQMTPREVITKMTAENAGLKMVNYLKLRADDIKAVRTAILTKAEEEQPKDLKGKDKEEWAKKLNAELTAAERSVNHMDLDQFGSLDEMFARVTNDTKQLFTGMAGKTDEEKQKKLVAVRDYTPEFSNPVAKRRWKLFEAFKHTDNGEVYSNKDWTVSICKTDRQLGIFARNKPKIGSDGSIIAAANLEDWEGITSDNRRIRDGGGDWVKDKLRKQYDGYETESVWCVAGSFLNRGRRVHEQMAMPWGHKMAHVNGGSDYGDYRVTDERHGKILLQFMNNNTGMLFMLGTTYILDEGDEGDGEICGRDGIETLRRHCARLPSLNQLITDCGLYKSLIEFHGLAKNKSEQEILQEAIDNGIVTPDGEMNIVSAKQLATYKSVVPRVSKINVKFSDASSLFKNVFNEQNVILPVVNCRDVTNADFMFYGVRSPTIDLENTDRIMSMTRMFAYAQTSEITGLDTSATTTLDATFYNCRQKVFQMISIPALDLRNCTNISNAFEESFISSVTMMNTDRIRRAVNAFLDMPFLQKVPDIRFKNVTGPDMLRHDASGHFDGDFTTIFDGCDALLGRSEFDKKIQEIEQYYMHPPKDRKSDFLDDRNFIVIHCADDVVTYAKYMYKYDGVVIAEDASCYKLFHQIPNLKIRILDINGHEDLHFMFYGCTSLAIGKIIGTENVKTAESMFYNSKCNVCPRLNFPNLTGQITVFRGMPPFGNNSSPGLLKTGQYVEDFDLSGYDQERISEIARQLFGQTATLWMQHTVIMNVVGSFYDDNIATRTKLVKEKYAIDDKGFITVDENAIRHNLRQILELKPKGLRLSKEFVEQLDQNPYSYADPTQNPLWQKTRGRNLSLPDIDLNGLKHGDMLFAGSQFAHNGKILGIDQLETARSMFYAANLPGVTNLGKLTFSKLTDATGMFKYVKAPVAFEDLSFPAVKVADKMFFGTPFVNAALDNVSFPQAIQAYHMFSKAVVTEIGELDMPKLQKSVSMFQDCTQLKLVGDIDLPVVTDCDHMFAGCTNLTNVSRFFVPNSTVCSFTFADCARLKVIHAFKVNAGSTEGMFHYSMLSVIYGKDGKALVARSKLLND